MPHSDGPPSTYLDGLLEGVLHIDVPNRCVTVEQDNSGTDYVVVFVDGAALDLTDPVSPALIRQNGERIVTGASVALGGGSWGMNPDFAESADPAYRNVEIPVTCRADSVWIAAPDL